MRKLVGQIVTVFTGSYAVGGNGAAANDFDITAALAKYQWVGDVVLQWVVTLTAGSSTTDLSILCSLDGGTSYSTLVAFTQIGAGLSGHEIKTIKVPKGALLKTDINLGTGSTSTITLRAAGSLLAM